MIFPLLKSFSRSVACFALVGVAVSEMASLGYAQESDKTAKSAPSQQNSELQREYTRLADLLNTGDTWQRREAAKTLLLVRPQDVVDPEVRKSIARGYREVAVNEHSLKKEGVTGLVIWGGSYSVPLLIDLMNKETVRVSEDILEGLAALKDPRGADAVAKHLGNTFNHDAAVSSLKKMGSASEDALIKAAPSNNAKVSLAAVKLLIDVGSEKSLPLLDKASQSRNPEIRTAARDATVAIRKRQKAGESVDEKIAVDPNSPFAPRSGPPVDILALKNSRNTPTSAATSAANGQGSAAPPRKERPLVKGDWSVVKDLKESTPRFGQQRIPVDPLSEGATSVGSGRSSRGRNAAGTPFISRASGRDAAIVWNVAFKPIRLADRAGAKERAIALAVAGLTSPTAAIVHSSDAKKYRLEVVRLNEGKLLESIDIEDDFRTCAISPAGTRLLVLNERSHGNLHRCDVYDLSGDKPRLLESWSPYAKDERMAFAEDVAWAEWINEEQFLSLGGHGDIVLWQAEGKKALYQIHDVWTKQIVLTPGKNYFATIAAFEVSGIYSSTSGELVAKPTDEMWKNTQPMFSPNGQFLTSQKGGRLRIWDLSTETAVHDVPFFTTTVNQYAHWLDDSLLWTDKGDVVDPARKSLVWRYTYSAKPQASDWLGPWHWMVLDEKVGLMLVPVKLPHAAATAAAKTIEPESLLLLRPGSEVSCVMQDVTNRDEVEAIVKQGLEKKGLKISPEQRVRFVAKEQLHAPRVQIYKKDANSKEEERVNVSGERSLTVTMELDGKMVWEWRTAVSAPTTARMGLFTGSLQGDVDRHLREAKYGQMDLPTDWLDPAKVAPHGSSYLTAAGVE